MYIIIWKYRVHHEKIREFVAAYNPEGTWVQLFRKHKGFIRTEFYQDPIDPDVFMTLDYWEQLADYQTYRDISADEFKEIDEHCNTFTQREQFIGAFELERDEADWET